MPKSAIIHVHSAECPAVLSQRPPEQEKLGTSASQWIADHGPGRASCPDFGLAESHARCGDVEPRRRHAQMDEVASDNFDIPHTLRE